LARIEQNYDNICVGLYKTMERALEILDDIQDILEPQEYTISGHSIYNISSYVYKMPEE